LTIFATFFVAAAAIERLLEPLSKLLPSATDMHADADTKLSDAGMKFAAGHSDAEDALNTAATLSDHASYRDYWKSISLWTVATLLAMVAAAFLRLYFLRTVGISNGPRPMEILATGLIIGSGTKPLHDLVTYISAAADAKTS